MHASMNFYSHDEKKKIYQISRAQGSSITERQQESRVERVLIVEDEWLLAMALKEQFEAQGYQVVGVAGNGEEAVELCRSTSPEVVIMDLQMPVMDGTSATRQLMQESPVCVVVLTGYSRFLNSAERAGAMGYAIKPLGARQIPSLLRNAQQRFARYMALRKETETHEQALNNWMIVQKAIHALADKEGMSEEEAAQRLQQSLSKGDSLLEAAEDFLRNNETIN